MSNTDDVFECGMCGTKLASDDKECPVCHCFLSRPLKGEGNTRKQQVLDVGIKQTDTKSGFTKRKMTMHRKKSEATGLTAITRLEIDRRDNEVTTKIHEVWEDTGKDNWEKVHDEKITFKAKRRKTQ